MKILDCEKLKDNVWYDSSEDITFNKNQFQVTKGVDFHFQNNKERWLHEKFSYVLDMFGNIGCGDTVFNTDYIYRKPKGFKKYQGSTIMLWSGGPSSARYFDDINDKKISIPEDVDYHWAMNNFYFKWEELMETHGLPAINLAVLNKEADKHDSALIDFIKKHNMDIVFEEAKDSMVGEEYLNDLFPDQTGWYNTRYQSKLGIGVRLLLFAIILGVKKIYVVGLDGLDKNDETAHAFENKKVFPNWNMNWDQVYNMIKRQFIIFWEYVQTDLNKEFDCEIVNLAENYTNVSTFGKITKEWNEEHK